MKTFVMGDPHGGLRAIKQVLERAKFDYENDRLICLGDVADGWSEVAEALEYLITKVSKLVYVRGNHDQWLKDWLKKGSRPDIWTLQGGQATLKSYLNHPDFPHIAQRHLEFLKRTPHFFVDAQKRLYVHGGITKGKLAQNETKRYLTWDRALWEDRWKLDSEPVPIYNTVYVGHTSIYRHSPKPLKFGNVWFMDTGGGWEGRLSVMNVDTEEIFQSDVLIELYPDEKGRN